MDYNMLKHHAPGGRSYLGPLSNIDNAILFLEFFLGGHLVTRIGRSEPMVLGSRPCCPDKTFHLRHWPKEVNEVG